MDKIDKILERLAHISQPGLLILGLFGYFYTVLPVFQNQQLQEQTAKLEIEKTTIQEQLNSLLSQQASVKGDIALLREKLEREKAHSDQLVNDVAQLKNSAIAARSQAAEAEEKLRQELITLDASRWKLILIELLSIRLNSELKSTDDYYHTIANKNYGDSILVAGEFWPKPYESLLTAIDSISKKNKFPEFYPLALRAFVTSRKSVLQCEKPNFNALRDEYNAQISALEPIIDIELNQYIAGIKNDYTAKGHLVEITDDFLSDSRKMIQNSKRVQIQSDFTVKISYLRMDCTKKVDSIIDEMNKKWL